MEWSQTLSIFKHWQSLEVLVNKMERGTSLLICICLFLYPLTHFGVLLPQRIFFFFHFFSSFWCLALATMFKRLEISATTSHCCSGSWRSRCSVVYHDRPKWNPSHVKVNFPAALAQIEITHSWLLPQKMSVYISDCSYQPLFTTAFSRHTEIPK